MIVHLVDGTYELFRHFYGLRSGRHRSLLARMPKPNAKKRRVNRVKGFASRGRGKKWILLLLVVLLLIPAMQVAVVRFINPPLTLPMLIDQGGAMFSSAPKRPLLYRWIALPQIPEIFLEHLWISEDQRFFQHEGFDWTEMELAMKKAERMLRRAREHRAALIDQHRQRQRRIDESHHRHLHRWDEQKSHEQEQNPFPGAGETA